MFWTTVAATALAPPVLRFTDCKSGRDIVLVGCMHYNPASISLAGSVVSAEVEAQRLGAVVLECCPLQWESTLRNQPPGSLLRAMCDNELQAAAELAERAGCGIALADQPIDVTSARLAQLSKQTVMQLATPGDGWRCVQRDIAEGWAALRPDGEGEGEGVGPLAFVAPSLLLGAPVALVRYLAASPALLVAACIALGLLAAPQPSAQPPLTAAELAPSVAVAALESVVLLRVLLVALIEERNFVLARNIRAASMQVLTPPRAVRQRGRGKDGRAVVAVLGLAHLNGVRRLLTTTRTM